MPSYTITVTDAQAVTLAEVFKVEAVDVEDTLNDYVENIAESTEVQKLDEEFKGKTKAEKEAMLTP